MHSIHILSNRCMYVCMYALGHILNTGCGHQNDEPSRPHQTSSQRRKNSSVKLTDEKL